MPNLDKSVIFLRRIEIGIPHKKNSRFAREKQGKNQGVFKHSIHFLQKRLFVTLFMRIIKYTEIMLIYE